MGEYRFETPWVLALLVAVPLLLALAWPYRRGATGSVRVGQLGAAHAANPTWRVRLEPALFVLRLAAVAALVLALARPQRGEARTELEGEGIDIVLAYDVSSSMTQPFGGQTTRLEAAEGVLTEFISARENDRVGLVAFQGSSITLSPLTTDYEAVATLAREAGKLQISDGTAIGTALGASVNVLRDSTAASRIVILLTDGENNEGELQPLAAARIAERLGVRVYTIGILATGFQANPARLNVDEESLRRMAEITGGTYGSARDTEALAASYTAIEELEKTRVEGRVFTRYDEWAPYVLAAAAAALALEVALRATIFRRVT
jgi:Ca-activated chloride channel family protein